MSLRYVQILDALDFGDAVSNQVLRIHQMLLETGERAEIYSKYADSRVERHRQNINDFMMDEDTIILYHFSGYSEIADKISSLRGYKIIVYHNITPHHFFSKESSIYQLCLKGRYQLQQIIQKYDLIVGDSPFNCEEAKILGGKQVREIPIIVPNIANTSIRQDLRNKIRSNFDNIWLFVGRIAPNKRQDLLIDIFASYIKLYPDQTHHIYLVGRYFEDDPYYNRICSKINELELHNQVTLVGKVEDEDISAYYDAANIFICMSEHEGFCVPIVEAFNHQIPVIAYAGTAVASTMGGGLGSLKSLNIGNAIELIHAVFTDKYLKNDLVAHGLKQATRFTPDSVRQHLYSILDEITPWKNRQAPLTVSVVICTCNRSEYLQRCLNYLKDQDYQHFEVIVVNGPSTDDTMEVIAGRKDIKIVQNPLRNLSVSRNLGIQHSAGDIVAFIDDDALPYENWLSEIVNRYQEVPNNVVGVGGRTFLANQFRFQFEFGICDSFGSAIHVSRHDQRRYSADYYTHLLGTNATFRRDALIAIAGFDEQYDYYLDETDLAVRLQKAGGVLVNADQAYVRHEFAQSYNRLGKYNFNWKTIVKNTAYFGIKNANEITFLPQKILLINQSIFKERCMSFVRAWRHKDLSWQEALYYCYCSVIGALRGYYDSFFPRKFGADLNKLNSALLLYQENRSKEMKVDNCHNDKLHILIISQEFPPHSFGGIGAYNQTLARELIQMGHEVTVISRAPLDCTQTIGLLTHIQLNVLEQNDAEYPILAKNLAWATKVAVTVREIHKQRPISVIESALWDFEGIGILMLRPEFKVPLIVRLVTPLLLSIEMNEWPMSEDFKLCIEMEKELIRCADVVIGISNSIQDTIRSTYEMIPDHRWIVQALGVQPWPAYTNITNYGELPKDLKREPVQILFIGRLESRKGIDVLLNALKIVMPQEPRISVWIAGADIEGWQEKASHLLGAHLVNRLQFLGVVTEERRELLYANCDFLVFPSRYESFGLVPLEVMVHGKPVIAAKAASIPEVVIEGECGLLFEPDNYQELAQNILTLVNDEDLQQRLSTGAKRRVEVLSARNMAKASVAVYHSLAKIDQLDPQIKISTNQIIENCRKNILGAEANKIQDEENNSIVNSPVINKKSDQMALNRNITLDSSFRWSVKKPLIQGWGWLNSILNQFVVPKTVKFIDSVLFDSMSKQNHLNELVISRNKGLEFELNEAKQNIEFELNESKQNIANVKVISENEIFEMKKILTEEREKTANILLEIKNIATATQATVSIENEITRSEFAYRLKSQLMEKALVVNQEKINANKDNLRLNLGCGQGIIPEYINVDRREIPGIDVLSDVSQLPFEEKSIAEIYNAHVIEHFTEYELKNHILPYWYQLLKDGGKIVIICPDAKSMVIDYANGNFPWENLRKVTYGSQDYEGNYHYNMYSSDSLMEALLSCGFKDVKLIDEKRLNGLCYEMEVWAIK